MNFADAVRIAPFRPQNIVYKSHHSQRYFYSFGRQVNLLSLKVKKCDTDNTGELVSVAAQSQE